MRLLRLPGVFKPPSDSWLLARVMRERGLAQDARALDVFTGSGVLAVAAALAGAREVTAVDVSRRAALCARVNGRLNGRRVRALRGDLFAPVSGERFDLITANPPYVPGDEIPTAGAARAWEGGRDGRALVDRFAAEAARHLAPGGTVLLVVSSLTGEAETLQSLREGGLDVRVIARERGPLGPLVSARAEVLERRGLLAPGEREEDMLVIEARRPRSAAYAEAAFAQLEADIGPPPRAIRGTYTYALERLELDREAYEIVALVPDPARPGALLGMRIDAEPEDPEEMPPDTWASIVLTHFEEALDTMEGPPSPTQGAEIRWIIT